MGCGFGALAVSEIRAHVAACADAHCTEFEFGNLAKGIERRIGQHISSSFVITEGDEHCRARRAAVCTRGECDAAPAARDGYPLPRFGSQLCEILRMKRADGSG